MKLSVEELETFVHVADSGSLTAAAALAKQTTSAVSRTLKRLEEKLGTTLVHRTTRRAVLSDEGSVLLDRAREILASIEHAEELVSAGHRCPAGRLRVDSAAPFVTHALAPLVPEFMDLYPEIRLELVSTDHVIDLLEQRTDIAIRFGPMRDSTLRARLLGRSRQRVVASPSYLATRGTPRTPRELDEPGRHRLLGFTEPTTLNHWPVRRQEDPPITPALEASSGEALRALALAGAGIASLGEFLVDADIARGDLVHLLPQVKVRSEEPIHAVFLKHNALSGRVRAFLDFLAPRLAGGR